MHTGKFGVTSKLQEIICLLAEQSVFEEAEALLHELLGIEISAKQIQRLSEHYGSELEESEKEFEEGAAEVPTIEVNNSESVVYVTLDGSMIFTREEGWKEIKLGRIYSEGSRVGIQPGRTEVTESLYVCTLGNHKSFLRKFEPYIEPYKQKVFIADGAKWIWNWVDDFYDDSVQILDFFHAIEKMGEYASLAYKDEQERHLWLEEIKERLKRDEIAEIIVELKEVSPGKSKEQKALQAVIRYYENNIERMKYGTFLKKGYLIGSGSIESANRNVIQQRMKLSGQRWSIQGAQSIANLRAYKKSNRWAEVISLIKKAA